MSEERFEYSYSAPTEEERREIESIRREYGRDNKTVSRLDEIRKYDKIVKRPARIVSLTLGIVGLLIFGGGMSIVLEWQMYILGVILSAFGLLVLGAAHPAYSHIFAAGKRRHGAKIIELIEALENEEKGSI